MRIILIDAALIVEVVPYLGLMLIHYSNFKENIESQSWQVSEQQTSAKQTTGSVKPESYNSELKEQLLEKPPGA